MVCLWADVIQRDGQLQQLPHPTQVVAEGPVGGVCRKEPEIPVLLVGKNQKYQFYWLYMCQCCSVTSWGCFIEQEIEHFDQEVTGEVWQGVGRHQVLHSLG